MVKLLENDDHDLVSPFLRQNLPRLRITQILPVCEKNNPLISLAIRFLPLGFCVVPFHELSSLPDELLLLKLLYQQSVLLLLDSLLRNSLTFLPRFYQPQEKPQSFLISFLFDLRIEVPLLLPK